MTSLWVYTWKRLLALGSEETPADEIIEGMLRYMRQAPKGKTGPEHSVPLELFVGLLHPNWRDNTSRGIRAEKRLHTPTFQRIFRELIDLIVRTEMAPYHFHLS